MTETDLQTAPPLTKSAIDQRIRFLDDVEIMEVDFSHLHLQTSAEVNQVYDRLEDRIRDSGEDQWFFVINYSDSRIDPEAWFAYARRGKTLNMAHSMGSVRFDASEVTRAQIERDSGTEAFDANLFADRTLAIARIAEIPSTRVTKIDYVPTYSRAEFERRIKFRVAEQIMDVDFSDITFHHSRDVADFYDLAQEKIEGTGRRWYFLVNYTNCRIMPEAWVVYAQRGKELNEGGSLGSVRYSPGSETEDEIRLRAESQDFRPNIRNSRDEAVARIDEMKAEAA